LSIGQGRAPFLPMPFLGVAATMSVRGILVGDGMVGSCWAGDIFGRMCANKIRVLDELVLLVGEIVWRFQFI
jgi:hypothetical protein